MSDKAQEIEIGSIVTITGAVLGKSEFKDGPPSYMVSFERRGRLVKEWFSAEELAPLGFDDGAAA